MQLTMKEGVKGGREASSQGTNEIQQQCENGHDNTTYSLFPPLTSQEG